MLSERIFIDTSAFYAMIDRSDARHVEAAGLWRSFLGTDLSLQTSNYVLVETLALLQSRLGFEAARLWYRDILSLVEVFWVDNSMHNLALELWMGLGKKKVSLVDCVSFVVMRNREVEKVFGFDKHFDEQGFEIIPATPAKSN